MISARIRSPENNEKHAYPSLGHIRLLTTSQKKPLLSVKQRWRSLGDDRLCVSVICEAEVLRGLEQRQSKGLWHAYTSLLQDRLPLLAADLQVAQAYAKLAAQSRSQGTPRTPFDLLIAATARVHRLTVATCNARDFHGLDGVIVEDWSTGPIHHR
ncbi:MAG: type II toxin-antitoxin system VapC family toxin [Myxococcota bacterium]